MSWQEHHLRRHSSSDYKKSAWRNLVWIEEEFPVQQIRPILLLFSPNSKLLSLWFSEQISYKSTYENPTSNLSLRNSPLYIICVFFFRVFYLVLYKSVNTASILMLLHFLPVVSSILLPSFFLLSSY